MFILKGGGYLLLLKRDFPFISSLVIYVKKSLLASLKGRAKQNYLSHELITVPPSPPPRTLAANQEKSTQI